MRIGPQATYHRTAKRPNGGRYHSRLRPCVNDRRNTEKTLNSEMKNFTPVAFVSKKFSPTQPKITIYVKSFWRSYTKAILGETTLPTLIMTDNRPVTRFFRTKLIPPRLWDVSDYVLQFKFRKRTSLLRKTQRHIFSNEQS